jgi:carboxylesterase type B
MLPLLTLTLTYLIITHAQRLVDTEYGQVRGHVINVDNGREQTTVDVFYNIPFAKPPIGALRFAVRVKLKQGRTAP